MAELRKIVAKKTEVTHYSALAWPKAGDGVLTLCGAFFTALDWHPVWPSAYDQVTCLLCLAEEIDDDSDAV